MKTKEIHTNFATSRVAQYADKLRDLVLEAYAEGIQLEISTGETHPNLKKKHSFYTQERVVVTMPQRLKHEFFHMPPTICASAIVDQRQLSDDHYGEAVVRATDPAFKIDPIDVK